MSVLVAFGSTKGKTMNYAHILADKYGLMATIMNSISVARILEVKNVIFLVSTYGKGEFPNSSLQFVKELQASACDFTGVRFAIIGLGSSKHVKYDQAARDLEEMMLSKNAELVIPLAEVDAKAEDKGESVFIKFLRDVAEPFELSVVNERKLCYDVKKINIQKPEPVCPIGYVYTHIISQSLLSADGIEPALHRYIIEKPSSFKYLLGGHIDLLPQNLENVVNNVLNVLKYNENDVISVTPSDVIPQHVTVRQLLTQYLDLNGYPSRSLITAFHQVSSDPTRLSEILNENSTVKFTEYIQKVNIYDFIMQNAEFGVPPIEIFVSVCPHMMPRTYSIASSRDISPNTFDLIVHDVTFKKIRQGLATSFLRSVGSGNIAIMEVDTSFKYPNDPDTPLILCGLGSGIAPCYSILSHRSTRAQKGEAVLLYGTQHKADFPKLLDEIEEFKQKGAINNYHIAFSRDTEKKYYITDLLTEIPDEIWSYWSNPKTVFYFCGPARGIPEGIKDFLIKLTMEKMQVDIEEATRFFDLHYWFVETF